MPQEETFSYSSLHVAEGKISLALTLDQWRIYKTVSPGEGEDGSIVI